MHHWRSVEPEYASYNALVSVERKFETCLRWKFELKNPPISSILAVFFRYSSLTLCVKHVYTSKILQNIEKSENFKWHHLNDATLKHDSYPFWTQYNDISALYKDHWWIKSTNISKKRGRKQKVDLSLFQVKLFQKGALTHISKLSSLICVLQGNLKQIWRRIKLHILKRGE